MKVISRNVSEYSGVGFCSQSDASCNSDFRLFAEMAVTDKLSLFFVVVNECV